MSPQLPSTEPSTDETYIVDNTSPAVSSIVRAGSNGSGTTYTVTVGTGSGDGTLSIDFDADADGGVTDAAGNVSGADFAGGESYAIDKTAATLTSF